MSVIVFLIILAELIVTKDVPDVMVYLLGMSWIGDNISKLANKIEEKK